MISELKSKLVGMADNIKSEILYDLRFASLNPVDFFRVKFDKDREDEIELCHTIYKYNKNG
jgi:hypothetical protein